MAKDKITRNKDGTPRKTGSGRTTGSFSFAQTTLGDLKKFFGTDNDNMPITIGRVWAEQTGYSKAVTLTSMSSSTLAGKIEGKTPESKVNVKEIDLDKE
jgi:hypothetical protein